MCLVTDPTFIVLNRFRNDSAEFPASARAAIAALAACAGFVDAHLGQSTDEPDLRTITTRWVSVGVTGLALDAGSIGLGEAAGPDIAAVDA